MHARPSLRVRHQENRAYFMAMPPILEDYVRENEIDGGKKGTGDKIARANCRSLSERWPDQGDRYDMLLPH